LFNLGKLKTKETLNKKENYKNKKEIDKTNKKNNKGNKYSGLSAIIPPIITPFLYGALVILSVSLFWYWNLNNVLNIGELGLKVPFFIIIVIVFGLISYLIGALIELAEFSIKISFPFVFLICFMISLSISASNIIFIC
ncbi:MAG: hypothetical protein ACTSXF_13980, partial [Promethearchaeota archaeon]